MYLVECFLADTVFFFFFSPTIYRLFFFLDEKGKVELSDGRNFDSSRVRFPYYATYIK